MPAPSSRRATCQRTAETEQCAQTSRSGFAVDDAADPESLCRSLYTTEVSDLIGAPDTIRTCDLCLRRNGVHRFQPYFSVFFDVQALRTEQKHHEVTRTECGRRPMFSAASF